MKNFFKKYWYHFTVWILMLLFLAFGPKLVAVFRMYSKGQKSEQLDGWAFLFGTADQSLYDRYLVLKSDTQTLFFPLKDVQRLDVQSAFSASGLDLQYSGFSATIFSDELASGTYQIGFVFQHRQNGSLVYGLSNGMLKRTPNTLTLTTIAPPTATRPPDSTMVNLDRHLPDPSDTITDYLDGLSADNSSEITQYKLSGWAFLPGEADQSKFERLIILRSRARMCKKPTRVKGSTFPTPASRFIIQKVPSLPASIPLASSSSSQMGSTVLTPCSSRNSSSTMMPGSWQTNHYHEE
jgi:hypothetical protein